MYGYQDNNIHVGL